MGDSMSIILQTPSNGSITLSEQNTASNITVTIPATTGTLLTTATAGVPIGGPAFSADANSATALANSTNTKIVFNTETFDTNNCFNTANSRFTPTVAGYYQVNANIQWLGGNLTQQFFTLQLYRNGAVYRELNVVTYMSTYARCVGSSLVYLNGSTDYLEIYSFQSSGGTVNIQGSEFSGSLVRSAT